jgi:hypothetical protein
MKPELCRALSTHAWVLIPPIVVLGDARRVLLHCERCDTYRTDVWSRTGSTLSRYYKHPSAYAAYIKDHKHIDARVAILAATKEVKHAGNDPTLRLVPGAPKIRGRNRRPPKRARDKRRAIA